MNTIKHFPLLALTLFIGCAATCFSQDSSPTPEPTAIPSAEEQALDERIRILTKESTIATLEKAIRDSQPQPSTTPLGGVATIGDTVSIESKILSYRAMSEIGDRMSDRIHSYDKNAKSIAVLSPTALEGWRSYRTLFPAFSSSVDAMNENYKQALAAYQREFPIALFSYYKTRIKLNDDGTQKLSLKGKEFSVNIASLMAGKETFENTQKMVELAAAVTGAHAVASSFVNFAALIRTDTDIKGVDVSIDEQALISESMRALRIKYGANLRLYNPALVHPQSYTSDPKFAACPSETEFDSHSSFSTDCSRTIRKLKELTKQRDEIRALILGSLPDVVAEVNELTIKRTRLQQRRENFEKEADKLSIEREKTTSDTVRDNLSRIIQKIQTEEIPRLDLEFAAADTALREPIRKKYLLERMEALNVVVDLFIVDFARHSEKTGKSQIVEFLGAEELEHALRGDHAYWVTLKPVASGGNNRTRRNLVRYVTGPKIDHSGGAIVQWQLFNKNGLLVEGDTFDYYGGYTSAKALRRTREICQDVSDKEKAAKCTAEKLALEKEKQEQQAAKNK